MPRQSIRLVQRHTRRSSKKQAIVVICYKPNYTWIDFLSRFTNYDVYMIIDDTSKVYKNDKIKIIQLPKSVCEKNGFTDMNYLMKKNVTGWEKAVYYFSNVIVSYKNIWFFEEDVFIYNEQALLDIDTKYPNSDLLTNKYTSQLDSPDWYHWPRITIKLNEPAYQAMVCATRMSKKMLKSIDTYAKKHNELFFLEALFPTLCKKSNLDYDTPEELNTIIYRKDYKAEQIDKAKLYHPVKTMRRQRDFRKYLDSRSSKKEKT